ncbi:MAG: MlaD family protein [Actinomycetota bacterium]|nr:MlaD family protein [Actinomycetota bacterium]
MRRLATFLTLAAVTGAAFVASAPGGNGDDDPRRYVVEFDNAFGMVLGGDVRVAGVNAGTITDIDLDEQSLKALVEVEIDEQGFGSLREDTTCETRPQSPLGEYFLDCNPGTAPREIEDGSRIAVERTTSTIPPDLVQNTMRRPYAERFRLVLNEFGAGLAGRPEDLNDAIRRGVPALRQTAQVLAILAEHDRVIRDLVGDAERVIGKLADNRRNVGRFVDEAEDTASASAERADDIALNFQKLPTFVRELRPTMAALGEAAMEQRPVLVDLSAAAPDLERFLDNSGEFAEVARPAIRALSEAAPVGREAVRAALPNTRELRRYAEPTTQLAPNLRITLEDFANPARAVEPDPRSPGGRGYSGLEAILRYVFSQSLTINGFDEFGHMVRAAVFTDDCSPYMDGERAKAEPELVERCNAWLGPNQPGINQPDPSPPVESAPAAAAAVRSTQRNRRTEADPGQILDYLLAP